MICDEAHPARFYSKYRDIFNYFDAPLSGLTAPKDEIDKNTYEIFELENGVLLMKHELAQAMKDMTIWWISYL